MFDIIGIIVKLDFTHVFIFHVFFLVFFFLFPFSLNHSQASTRVNGKMIEDMDMACLLIQSQDIDTRDSGTTQGDMGRVRYSCRMVTRLLGRGQQANVLLWNFLLLRTHRGQIRSFEQNKKNFSLSFIIFVKSF